MNQEKVIILGCKHGGLAAARSFGRRGIKTLVLTHDESDFGLSSRFVKEYAICPHPKDEAAFIAFLLSYAEEWRGALVIETFDYFLEPVSKSKALLEKYFRIVAPDWDKAQIFLEKNRAYRLADECGVPHPAVIEPKSMVELEEQVHSLQFPVIIKPVSSHQFVAVFEVKMFVVETAAELRSLFQRTLDAKQAVIISELIPGTDYASLERVQVYIDSKGELATAFSNLKLRQTPPMFGVMRVGKSIPPSEEVTELALRLLRGVDFRGFASVEFKRDYRDNTLKLMEVNVRLPRSLPLPIQAGVDFPFIIFQDLVRNEQVKVETYNENTYLVEIVADVGNFVKRDKDKNLLRFVQPYLARNKTFSILEFSDPMPFFGQFLRRFSRFFEKLGKQVSGKNAQRELLPSSEES
jgi:D-aspartate ligase